MNNVEDTLFILDWGIGGIGAFLEIRKRRPNLNILYWSDSGALPYGKMDENILNSRILDVLNAAKDLGATHALIACNAASTVLPAIETPIPTIGVIRKGVEKLIHEKNMGNPRKHIGIIGGKRTIESAAWSAPLIQEGFKVSSNVAQPLSAIIESGRHLEPEARSTFAEVLAGLEDVSDLVLACTHYIIAADVITSILPNVALFDPVHECVTFAIEQWNLNGAGLAETRFLTSGDILEMERSTKLAYGLNITGSVFSSPKS